MSSHDDPRWTRLDLGDGTAANISARSGAVTIKQQEPGGELATVYLSPEQISALFAAIGAAGTSLSARSAEQVI